MIPVQQGSHFRGSRSVLNHRLVQRHLLGCACAIACAILTTLGITSSTAATHYVHVNYDGSFSPPTLAIEEGDRVVFRGPVIEIPLPEPLGGVIPIQLPMRTTDAVVRVNQADIDAAARRSVVPRVYAAVYYDNMLPGHDNEFTGPLRRGTSGIYALGPEAQQGLLRGARDRHVRNDLAPRPVLRHRWRRGVARGRRPRAKRGLRRECSDDLCYKEIKGTSNRTELTLCAEHVEQPRRHGRGHSNKLARTLHDHRWSGNTEIVTLDYTKLDTELENAATRGKLVFLELLAGDGIPPWIFNDYDPLVDTTATGLAAKSVIPIETSDFGTSSDTNMPTSRSCGYDKTMGSPADDAYKTALLTMLRDVAARIRSNARHYQALGSLKVTGLNFLTGEMRLPKRCLNPLDENRNGSSQSTCYCNTRIWATPLGDDVAAYDDPNLANDVVPLTVFGGGYTSEIAQNFINAVENTIYVELGRRKTMHYMLIQDGFPKVFDGTHYDMDSGAVGLNEGYVDANGDRIPFDQQTVDALDGGQAGNFRKVNADGSPNLAGDLDPDAPRAVLADARGARPDPRCAPSRVAERPTGAHWPQRLLPELPTALVDGKTEAVVVDPADPIAAANFNDYSGGGGCPNKWAAREGFEGQIIGCQTQNTSDSAPMISRPRCGTRR